jgi:cytochrome c
MNSMTIAKYGGAACVMLLAYLVLNFIMHDGLFHPEQLETAAYKIETDGEGGGGGGEAAPTLPELLAAADLGKGEKVFKKCGACHKVEAGANGVGPNLWNVVGRDIGSADGFAYSGDLSGMDGDWTWDKLDAFITNPKGFAPGTKMGFAGLKKPEDRANVLAYLNQSGDAPIDLPAVEAAAAPAEAPVETAAAVEGAVESATDAVAEAAESATEAVADAAESATEAVTEAAEGAADAAAAAAGAAVVAAVSDAPDPALVEAGEKVFRKCKACHKLEEGKHGVGPSLAGVVGKDIASAEGFGYSDALTGIEGEWDAAKLDAFLAKPKDYAPGTKMTFAGLSKEEDRAAIIAYLSAH